MPAAHPLFKPTGLGTAAAYLLPPTARLGLGRRSKSFSFVPYEKVGPSPLPQIRMPYRTTLCVHLDSARENLLVWGRLMGFLDPVPGLPGPALWSEQDLRDGDYALCSAGLDPDATPAELDLSAGWLAWGTYVDDFYPEHFAKHRDLLGAKQQSKRLAAFMPLGPDAPPEPANPMERGLADLWLRTTAAMNDGQRREFRQAVEGFLEACDWEIGNFVLNRVPDPVDYVEMRRRTFGSDFTTALSRLSHGQQVPAEVYRTQAVTDLEKTAIDVATFVNDLTSYQKETQFEGDPHNMVVVMRNFFDCDRDRAVGIVSDLLHARLEQFQRVVAVDLPTLYEDHGLDEQARRVLDQRATELQDWMAGILTWHIECRRYREEALLARFGGDRAADRADGAAPLRMLRGPSGLGTMSTRIAGVLRRAADGGHLPAVGRPGTGPGGVPGPATPVGRRTWTG